MENNNQIPPPEEIHQQQTASQSKAWHKGIVAVIVLAILAAVVSWGYLSQQKKQNDLTESKTTAHTPKQTLSTSVGEYVVAIDSTVKRVSFSIVFKPENRDKTYDLLSKTGGQGFYLRPSEVSKFVNIEAATRGEPILVLSDEFSVDKPRSIIITSPSGKTITPDQNTELTIWSAGEVITVKNPEPGNWKLSIAGSGEFSAQAMVDSGISIISWDFVKLGGRPAHEGYFPIDKTPSIGANQILQVNLSEDSDKSEMPKFQLIDESGKIIDSPNFYAITRGELGEFAGIVKIPSQDFRISAYGVDSQGFKYQRIYAATIHPDQKPAPLTQQEIDEFVKGGEQAQSISENIASSKVLDVYDEPLLTSNGNIIGIKVKYKIRFPKDMSYAGGPQAPSADFGKYGLYLTPQKTDINPPLSGGGYRGGVEYTFNIDYIPFFIRNDGPSKSLCIWHVDAVNDLSQNNSKAKFKIMIPEANYTGLTEHEYSPQVFYQSAIKEGAKDCVY